MKNIFLLLTLILCLTIQGGAQTDLGIDRWERHEKHDGYVLGNGKMYMIGGLGQALERKGKSRLTEKKTSLSRISWLIGPSYPVGNLGYGWEFVPLFNRDTIGWDSETILAPAPSRPFWTLKSRAEFLAIDSEDVLLSNESVFLRKIELTANSDGDFQLFLPVWPDPRNSYFPMFSGKEIDQEQVERWTYLCGPNLKPRASIPVERLIQNFPKDKMIVLPGANRALWQEVSTIVPDEEEYQGIFPFRAAASTIELSHDSDQLEVRNSGFHINFGKLKKGETRTLYLFITCVSQQEPNIEGKARQYLSEQLAKGGAVLMEEAEAGLMQAPFVFPDEPEHPITRSINSCLQLSLACKADQGGVMAQPYMYPMYYVRDQYGSFRLLLAAGEYEKALEILRFYIAKENREGIQNAHDPFGGDFDITLWDAAANAKNGHHANAEVPSYIILMARDYYQATGDLEHLRPLYDRLKYNLHIQKPSKNGVLPYEGDESFTNTAQTRPKFGDEMTDSHQLFLAAAAFLRELANEMDQKEDAQEFQKTLDAAWQVYFDRLILQEENRLIYARDDSDSLQNRDLRPVLDPLLRWFHLEMGESNADLAQGNLQSVLQELVNPLRVVPEYEWCTGMDLGYLLYALSRTQKSEVHDAAQLMMNYASEVGLYSEYYRYSGDSIQSQSGTLRPWESGVNGMALIQYLSGMRLDLPQKKIYLQPHLPSGVGHWESKPWPIFREGFLQMKMKREGDEVEFTIDRTSGENPIDIEIDFGGFGAAIKAINPELMATQSDRLQVNFSVEPGSDNKVFRFTILD